MPDSFIATQSVVFEKGPYDFILWRQGDILRKYDACYEGFGGIMYDFKKMHVLFFDASTFEYSFYPLNWKTPEGLKNVSLFVLFKPDRKVSYMGEGVFEGKSCRKFFFKAPPCESAIVWVDKDKNVPLKITDAEGKREVVFKNFQANVDVTKFITIPGAFKEIPNLNYRRSE